MATFNYYARLNGPSRRNMIWSEVIHMEDRNHTSHCLNTGPSDFYSIDGVEVGKNDFYKPTLDWIKCKYYMAAGEPTEIVKCARKTKFNPYNLRDLNEVIKTTNSQPNPNNTMGFNRTHKGLPKDPNNLFDSRPYYQEKKLQRTASYHSTGKKPPVEVISARSSRSATPRIGSARSMSARSGSAR